MFSSKRFQKENSAFRISCIFIKIKRYNRIIMKPLLLIAIFICTLTASAQNFKNLVETNGKIGIGTNKPDALLTVKGQIHTQEVLVDLEGAVAPDYVFQTYFDGSSLLKPAYRFRSLSETEAFIAANHHLPGIPSAETLSKEGLELKKMNLLLLEKLEELTLHTISQQHAIEALQRDLKALRTQSDE